MLPYPDEPIFGGGPGYDGPPNYTPNPPGETPPDPIPVAPPPPAGVTPGAVLPPTPRPVPRFAPTALAVPTPDPVSLMTVDDYAEGLRRLMPRGLLWPEEPDTVQTSVLRALARSFQRTDAAAMTLLSGTLPGSPTTMLPEWEATLGLPDPCAGTNPTIAQRLDQVRGRFVGAGGQSRQHFIDFAAALGFDISITNYAPFRVGISTAGNPVAGDDVTFVWGVTVNAITGDLPVDVLKCELEAVQPAEGTLIFLNA